MSAIAPVDPALSWDGSVSESRWRIELDAGVAAELLTVVTDLGDRPLVGIHAAELDCPRLRDVVARSETALWTTSGPGFGVATGLPVEDLSEAEVERLYWVVGLHFGMPLTQSNRGDLLGHVRHDPTASAYRGYKSTGQQHFHTDLTPLAGLLCRRKAKAGGQSAVVCAAAVHNAMLEQSPELTATCYGRFPFGRLGEQAPHEPAFTLHPIFAPASEGFGVLYGRTMIVQTQELSDAPRLTDEQEAALQLFDETTGIASLAFTHQLEVGELLLLANHRVLHARTVFEDFEEPDRRRHLLRLWLEPSVAPGVIPASVRFDYRFGRTGLRAEDVPAPTHTGST